MAYEELTAKPWGTNHAGADLSNSQYKFVKFDGSGNIILANVLGEAGVLGVLQNKPALNRSATVATYGITKAAAGAAVVKGARITTDATGAAITAVATNFSQGIALSAAGGVGEIISLLLQQGGGTV